MNHLEEMKFISVSYQANGLSEIRNSSTRTIQEIDRGKRNLDAVASLSANVECNSNDNLLHHVSPLS